MKKVIITLIIIIVLSVIYVFSVNTYVKLSTKDKILTIKEATKLEDIDCILVLGAGIWGDKPSPMLEDRLLTGIELYNKKVSNKIVMSGDHGQEEYDEVTVNINVTSTSPYKKTLLGTYKLTKDKSVNGIVDINYYNYDNYDRLVVSNTYLTEKCAKISFDSSKLRIETPLNNVNSYDKDENGYINSITIQIPSKENKSFKFYKLDSNIYTKEDFTIIESDC